MSCILTASIFNERFHALGQEIMLVATFGSFSKSLESRRQKTMDIRFYKQ